MEGLFVGGTIVTMDENRRVLRGHAIAVCGEKIKEIGPEKELREKYNHFQIIDCTNHCVLPGLIDCHGHSGHSLLKGLSVDTIHNWGDSVYQIQFLYSDEEFWAADGRLAAMDRLKNGVTTSVSVIGCEPRADKPDYAREVALGYEKLGARAVIGVGPGSAEWPKKVGQYQEGKRKEVYASWEDYMNSTEALLQEFGKEDHERIRIFVTPFTVLPNKPTWGRTAPERCHCLTAFEKMQMREVKRLAAKYDTGIHSDAFGNLIHLMAMAEEALLGPNVLLQHCHDLSMDEIRILAQTKTNVGHSPESTVRYCPYAEMLAEHVNVAITSDGTAPRNGYDLFQIMRKIQMLEHYRFDDINYLPVGTLLEGITVNAARALGMEKEIGSLEDGKDADIVTVSMDKPHLVPWEDMPVHRLVLDANGHDVDQVWVKGRQCVDKRKLLLADEDQIVREADRIAKRCVGEAGLEGEWNVPVWRSAYRY